MENTLFSTEHKQETRRLRRIETFEAKHAKETIVPAILALGVTPILRSVQPCGPGTGISHYDLLVVTKGDDWTRENQFRQADRIANAEIYGR